MNCFDQVLTTVLKRGTEYLVNWARLWPASPYSSNFRRLISSPGWWGALRLKCLSPSRCVITWMCRCDVARIRFFFEYLAAGLFVCIQSTLLAPQAPWHSEHFEDKTCFGCSASSQASCGSGFGSPCGPTGRARWCPDGARPGGGDLGLGGKGCRTLSLGVPAAMKELHS